MTQKIVIYVRLIYVTLINCSVEYRIGGMFQALTQLSWSVGNPERVLPSGDPTLLIFTGMQHFDTPIVPCSFEASL